MKRRLVLVNPVNAGRTGFSVNRSSRFPPLALGIIADLTPDSWTVELVDENVEPFTYRDADLVGLTAFTSSVNRAYKIADQYRQRGVPVVMGGIHASMCQDEALQFVDAVVVGEVETVWPQVMADFAAGKLRTAYHGAWPELTHLGNARRDLFDNGYMFASMQTSRGCPLDCDFCSVTAYNGRRYRRRPPDEVLDELETISQRLLFFVDDNIVGYGSESRQQAITLCAHALSCCCIKASLIRLLLLGLRMRHALIVGVVLEDWTSDVVGKPLPVDRNNTITLAVLIRRNNSGLWTL